MKSLKSSGLHADWNCFVLQAPIGIGHLTFERGLAADAI